MGFRVSVRIVTQAVDRVVRVPASAVFPLPPDAPVAEASAAPLPLAASVAATTASGAPANAGDAPARMAVFTLDGGRARVTPIELGARNGVDAWIRQGLRDGDTVIVYPPAVVRDGTRVAVRKV